MIKVFVNGAFDVLHTGHLNLLRTAKSMGDHLLVAIDTGRRIREKKGQDRPFNSDENRFELMSELRSVDSVKFFDTDEDLIDIIREYAPHIMVKGSDWRGKEIIGEQFVGKVVFYERVNNESTTKTIQGYIDRRQLC